MTVASLYGWNPRISDRGARHRTIDILLTPYSGTGDADASRCLCTEILACLQLDREPVTWHLQPFITSYFSEPGVTGPGRWRRAWLLTIGLDREIDRVPALRHEFFELVHGGKWAPGQRDPEPGIPYWVICDFRDERSAQAAAAEIRGRQPAAAATTLNLNDQFVQLRIELGSTPPGGFATVADWAETAEQICRKRGGIPGNDEREQEWDVVYDEDGIAFDD